MVAQIDNLQQANELITQDRQESEQTFLTRLAGKQEELRHEIKINLGVKSKCEVLEKKVDQFELQEQEQKVKGEKETKKIEDKIRQLQSTIQDLE